MTDYSTHPLIVAAKRAVLDHEARECAASEALARRRIAVAQCSQIIDEIGATAVGRLIGQTPSTVKNDLLEGLRIKDQAVRTCPPPEG